MSSNQKISDLIANILKRDMLKGLQEQATNGDELAQLILGDIYFYGINTDDVYWENINRTIALARYAKKMDLPNYAFVCSCNREPDYDEALKWYKMAALNKNATAENKIREIQDKVQTKKTNSITKVFMYDYKKIMSKNT